ncbi:MAG: TRAP transporter large permease subunit [Alphaproteobacteria bacterium]|nr:MAG: TRAP transporter large permease subunit [Alphaproteobacteria bacterium]
MAGDLVTWLPLVMFAVLTILLFTGVPVMFVLGGTAVLFWAIAVALGIENPLTFFLVVGRVFGEVVDNLVLVAIPMFILMGVAMEQSGIARDLLQSLQLMLRRFPGGLALAVTLLGVVMAATTGIIGASVVMMTLMALPVMLDQGYEPGLATGTIAASGTLGILIPPSIMLVVMADLLGSSVGTLFVAAIGPGLLLALLYGLYIVLRAHLRPDEAPPMTEAARADALGDRGMLRQLMGSFVAPVLLILAVLGSIIAGVATPTEASGIGAAGALLLAAVRGGLKDGALGVILERTVLTSAMLFGIFVGATAFSYIFALLGGHDRIVEIVDALGAGPWGVLLTLMAVVFLLGFFFDWIQITLIILPVFAPVIARLDFGGHIPWPELVVPWFAVLMAVNLQTSFLTPPFGFALFYMKGSAPAGVRMQDIYRGIIPFVILQILGLLLVTLWPQIALWLPHRLGG